MDGPYRLDVDLIDKGWKHSLDQKVVLHCDIDEYLLAEQADADLTGHCSMLLQVLNCDVT